MRSYVLSILLGLLVLEAFDASVLLAAAHNSLMLNLANTVSGSSFLDKGRADTTLGRLEGNGQNWLEFMVAQGDDLGGGAFSNTLDVRGWKIEWSYNKMDPADPNKYGSGTIQFTNDPLWAAVPKGAFITMNEWQKVWYLTDTPAGYDPAGTGGLQRDGGIAGVGAQHGNAYDPAIHTLRDFSTDTQWNPHKGGGGAAGDWEIHVWAGERNPDTSYKYFNFTGSIVDGDPSNPIPIGTDAAGLFAANNDNWQWTVKDAANNVVQGPFGEQDTGLGSTWRVSSVEIVRLEAFGVGTNPTQATYLGATIGNYRDGSSSTYGQPNTWSSGAGLQDLSPLRNWLHDGDVNLDGRVDGADFLAWQRGLGATHPSLTNGDLDGDGTVAGPDLSIWKTNFGAAGVAAAASVPEASSLALAVVAGCLATHGRRRLARRAC